MYLHAGVFIPSNFVMFQTGYEGW